MAAGALAANASTLREQKPSGRFPSNASVPNCLSQRDSAAAPILEQEWEHWSELEESRRASAPFLCTFLGKGKKRFFSLPFEILATLSFFFFYFVTNLRIKC